MRLVNPRPYVNPSNEVESGRSYSQKQALQLWAKRQQALMQEAVIIRKDFKAAINIMGNDRRVFSQELVRIRPEQISDSCYVQICESNLNFWRMWDSERKELELEGWRIHRTRHGQWKPQLYTSLEQIEHYRTTLQIIPNGFVPEG